MNNGSRVDGRKGDLGHITEAWNMCWGSQSITEVLEEERDTMGPILGGYDYGRAYVKIWRTEGRETGFESEAGLVDIGRFIKQSWKLIILCT